MNVKLFKIMQTNFFEYLVKEKLPINEVSVFGEYSILPYKAQKETSIPNDLNNLTNKQILSIIKDTSISLNYQFFSISIFHFDFDRIVFFTQKIDGIKSTLSQIFLNNEPVLIVETNFLNLLEILIEKFKKEYRTDLSHLIDEFSYYQYRKKSNRTSELFTTLIFKP